ncbi:uncharacterized protein EV422DRAFT_574960 [Fimicolochytrium jonesii]|uniref:uncharacterized protein n=1 Tax=Fimicolochytrium jonesii TaxID=1396493 RepID=UPI0022FDDBFC|nr:uncharacterized protein EV422DRAFT_574960 [Fimicolochytrium jonesii]KAI8826546.1 hypothetical protein EV422DRAFT_574960 [Fimicolochytrium jonesii]
MNMNMDEDAVLCVLSDPVADGGMFENIREIRGWYAFEQRKHVRSDLWDRVVHLSTSKDGVFNAGNGAVIHRSRLRSRPGWMRETLLNDNGKICYMDAPTALLHGNSSPPSPVPPAIVKSTETPLPKSLKRRSTLSRVTLWNMFPANNHVVLRCPPTGTSDDAGGGLRFHCTELERPQRPFHSKPIYAGNDTVGRKFHSDGILVHFKRHDANINCWTALAPAAGLGAAVGEKGSAYELASRSSTSLMDCGHILRCVLLWTAEGVFERCRLLDFALLSAGPYQRKVSQIPPAESGTTCPASSKNLTSQTYPPYPPRRAAHFSYRGVAFHGENDRLQSPPKTDSILYNSKQIYFFPRSQEVGEGTYTHTYNKCIASNTVEWICNVDRAREPEPWEWHLLPRYPSSQWDGLRFDMNKRTWRILKQRQTSRPSRTHWQAGMWPRHEFRGEAQAKIGGVETVREERVKMAVLLGKPSFVWEGIRRDQMMRGIGISHIPAMRKYLMNLRDASEHWEVIQVERLAWGCLLRMRTGGIRTCSGSYSTR